MSRKYKYALAATVATAGAGGLGLIWAKNQLAKIGTAYYPDGAINQSGIKIGGKLVISNPTTLRGTIHNPAFNLRLKGESGWPVQSRPQSTAQKIRIEPRSETALDIEATIPWSVEGVSTLANAVKSLFGGKIELEVLPIITLKLLNLVPLSIPFEVQQVQFTINSDLFSSGLFKTITGGLFGIQSRRAQPRLHVQRFETDISHPLTHGYATITTQY